MAMFLDEPFRQGGVAEGCTPFLYFHAHAARRARAARKQKSCNQHEEYEGNEC